MVGVMQTFRALVSIALAFSVSGCAQSLVPRHAAADFPRSDPRADALRTTQRNPPMDLARTLEFNGHRAGGVPDVVRFRTGIRPSAGGRTVQNYVTGSDEFPGDPGQTGTTVAESASSSYFGMYAGHSGWYADRKS